ncbi:MAG: LptE family protein [bacterium]
MINKVIISTIIISIIILSCKYYTFTPNLPKYIRNINITTFKNNAYQYGLEIELTQRVIDEFISEGTLKIVDIANADAVLSGSIESYRLVPVSYDQYEQVKDYKLDIRLNLRFENKNTREIIWEDSLIDYVHFYPSGTGGGTRNEYDARKELIDKLAKDIVRKTIEGW